MKQFYTKVKEIIDNHLKALNVYHEGVRAAWANTRWSESGRSEELKRLESECMTAGETNYNAFIQAIKEKRAQLPAQLNTWKHANDPALTNILMVIGNSGKNISSSQLMAMAEPFKDDFISINAIRAAATNSGMNEETIKVLHSNIGDNPEKVLAAFEQRAHSAFIISPRLNPPALSQLNLYIEKALQDEDISHDVQTYADVL